MSYESRALECSNPLTKTLLKLMVTKQTNLCVAVDVTTTGALLDLLPRIGPHICVLKLHIDILDDFSPSFIERLKAAKKEYNFLIFEDRKFADIGSTVAHQYGGGVYRICDWADLVTVHSVPGPGIITGLYSVARGCNEPRGILLLAEMSSSGTLCTDDYAASTIAMAEPEKQFVVGFIAQSRPASIASHYLVLTPGVSLTAKGDAMGQQYATPENAIQRGSDIVIVGRGIYAAQNVEEETVKYRHAAWNAYLASLQ